MIQKIGSMVYQLRKKLYVSQERLGRGLLSGPELSRIENGDKEGDSFLMSALFQRLGKSMAQFEMTVTNDEYKLVLLRAFIQESMESGEYNRTEELLDEYEASVESEKKLHRQYIGLMRALLRYVQTKEAVVCLKELQEAIALTFEDNGSVDWTGYCFYVQEIQLFLLIAYMQMETGATREAVLMLEKLHDCIDANYTFEMKVGVYSKCCYLMAKGYLDMQEHQKALEICGKGIECLIQNGSMLFIEELIDIQQRCGSSADNQGVLEGIRLAQSLANFSTTEEFAVRLLFCGYGKEIALSNEIIREMRIVQGRSQEEVSDGICSRESLTRIEKGRTVSRKKLQEILKKLGIEREKFYSYVITDDWDTYEMIAEYKKKCFESQGEVFSIIKEIEQRIDLSIPANRQFVEFAYLRDRIKKEEVTYGEAVEKLINILHYTMPEYDGNLLRIPYREEFLILNRIALCLKWDGKFEEAINMYEELLGKYQSSKVDLQHHVTEMKLLYMNYFGLLERCGYLEKAEEYAKKALAFVLKSRQGGVLGVCLANLACVYEKQSTQAKKENLIFECLNASHDLFAFYRCKKRQAIVKRHIIQLDIKANQ